MEDIEVLVNEEKPKKRGGRRPGAGRPSLVRENIERAKQGLPPLSNITKKKPKPKKSTAILPEKRKARHQEILAEMLGKKSQYIVQKVLNKALDDDDPDQMACLKLVMDRVLPQDYISKSNNKSNGITIQIMGVDAKVEPLQTIEAEYEEVDG